MESLSDLKHENIVYLDEFGIEQKINREYGWSKSGEPVQERITGKREKKINGIAGYIQRKIIAPFMYTGTMNTELFNKYIQECLWPELQAGQIVILDNASFHKSEKTKSLLQQKDCHLLFLPPYSPDLNPIEHMWALLKQEIKRVRSQVSSLWEAIEHIFSTHPVFL